MKKLILTGMILMGIQMMAYIPPAPYYSIRNNSIYWAEKELKDIDLKTLTIITIDGENISLKDYLNNYNSKGQIDFHFIKDKNNVYYQGEKIEGADSNTFKAVQYNYYFKDKNNVYYKEQKIKGVDPDTFEVLGYRYSKDKNNVYNYKEKIEGADPDTFEILKHDYSKDKNNVYYQGKKIKDADSATFEVLNSIYCQDSYSKDKSNVYYEGKKIKDADPVTFELSNKLNVNYDAKDKNHKYRYGKITAD